MAVNLQTAFIAPLVSLAHFSLQRTTPKDVESADMHKEAMPFMALQLVVLILRIPFPGAVTWTIERVAEDRRRSA